MSAPRARSAQRWQSRSSWKGPCRRARSSENCIPPEKSLSGPLLEGHSTLKPARAKSATYRVDVGCRVGRGRACSCLLADAARQNQEVTLSSGSSWQRSRRWSPCAAEDRGRLGRLCCSFALTVTPILNASGGNDHARPALPQSCCSRLHFR